MKTFTKRFAGSLTFLVAAAVSSPASAQVTTGSILREIADLVSQVRNLVDTVKDLKASNEALKARLKCVSTLSGGNDFIFEGCNVHVRNGLGTTGSTNKYGNLIIGYNKNEVSLRTGSHNVIVGDLHEYTSTGGIVSGTENALRGPNSTILSSIQSVSNASSGTIISADRGITDAIGTIIGGKQNYLSPTGGFGAVIGGRENHATGGNAVAVGGVFNTASGGNSLACGGAENEAFGSGTTACGGSSNISNGLNAAVNGGSHNTANGRASSVSGGRNNIANGDYSSILGGNTVVVNALDGTSP